MLTAEQIANKTGIVLRSVQYRLSVLRKAGKIKADRYGQTFVYEHRALREVKKFGMKKGKSK